MKNLQYFLKEVNLLREKYLIANQNREQFNIFTTLLPANNEVELHSRFISSLLDPKGKHHLGTRPVELLLKEIGSEIPVTPNIEVIPNNETWIEHEEIDILIIDRVVKNAIIVENKIKAPDSNHEDRGQLEGYYQKIIAEGIPPENIEVYYLTKDRHDPSDESLCTNGKTPELYEKVQCIDYATELANWLKRLSMEAYNHPYLRETINQYINLIKEMTGNLDIKEQQNIMEIVGKNSDNLQSAKLLIENYENICRLSIECFNQELQNAMASQKISVTSAPDEEIIRKIVHGGPRQKKEEFFYYIEGKNGLVWSLNAEHSDENGFCIGLEKNANKKLAKEQKQAIKDYVADNNLNHNETWFYWKYLSVEYGTPLLYLWDFVLPKSNTFDLISPISRKEIIDSFVKAVKKEIKFTV